MTIIHRAAFVCSKPLSPSRANYPCVAVVRKFRKQTNAATNLETRPNLVKVPSLPVIGSMIPQYSGTPSLLPEHQLQAFPEMRKKFGDFYQFGYPGIGKLWDPAVYVLQDPHEFSRILRFEGKYPSGATQYMWPVTHYMKEHDMGRGMKILDHGPEWRRIRDFAQTDLLAPKSAARYLPAIIEASEYTSKGAQDHQGDVRTYLNKCSFDMANAFLLGRLPRIADPTIESDPDDIECCESIAKALEYSVELLLDPVSRIMVQLLGLKNKRYVIFEGSMSRAYYLGGKRFDEMLERRINGTLSRAEESSYANQALDRKEAGMDQQDPIQLEEVSTIVKALLNASVDTTSAVLSWNILHLAQNPEIQERARTEVVNATAGTDGRLTEELFRESRLPFLSAVIRESHRITIGNPVTPFRVIPDTIEVHGVQIPGGSVFAFDGYSQGMDPDFVDSPNEFRPERFLAEAVAARQGTKSEILDHPLMSSSFSQRSSLSWIPCCSVRNDGNSGPDFVGLDHNDRYEGFERCAGQIAYRSGPSVARVAHLA